MSVKSVLARSFPLQENPRLDSVLLWSKENNDRKSSLNGSSCAEHDDEYDEGMPINVRESYSTTIAEIEGSFRAGIAQNWKWLTCKHSLVTVPDL